MVFSETHDLLKAMMQIAVVATMVMAVWRPWLVPSSLGVAIAIGWPRAPFARGPFVPTPMPTCCPALAAAGEDAYNHMRVNGTTRLTECQQRRTHE